ncbi:MAG: ABC transporter ATP-binding protein [Candidatus Delongbacteria bacterium]|jgi:putative ABC transport system ATP-binding protein|nr:ABC transporter ATP-binding protein [Candidatus Delongbacteria bacterium]
MIAIKDLHKTYYTGKTNLHVLKGVNLTIEKGEMVSIMGSSGSGKSTLLNVLGILDKFEDGEYYLNDTLIKNLTEKEESYLRNRKIGFVFQDASLIPYKNAIENVSLPLYYQRISKRKRNLRAIEYLEMFGLKEWGTHLPGELSGGQRQRVAIARAMICNPQVILADEPTGQLDSSTSMEVMQLFKEINQNGITVIIVTHEHDIAKETNRIIHIKDGIVM